MADIDSSLPSPQPGNMPRSSLPQEGRRVGFVDWLAVLIRKKALVFFITSFSMLLAFGYSLLVTPVYRASIGFLPPKELSIPGLLNTTKFTATEQHSMNPGITLGQPLNETIFNNFLSRLRSYQHMVEVLKSGKFLEKLAIDSRGSKAPEKEFSRLYSSISIKQDILSKDKRFREPTYVRMVGTKPEVMVDFLNTLSQIAINNVRSETLNQLQTTIDDRLRIISSGETALIYEGNQRRLKNISDLTKDLKIARKLGIKENNFKHSNFAGYGLPRIFLKNTPKEPYWFLPTQPNWFLYGERALVEEINRLKSNENMYVDLDRLMAVQSEAKQLKSIDLSKFKIEVATIDEPGIPPSTPIKPRKLLIISIGVLMGLFLGILVALIDDTLINLKGRKESSSL